MKKIVVNLLISAVVAFVLQKLLSGVYFEDFGTAIVFAVVLGLLNIFVKPVLKLLSLPLTIFTFGLFSLVVNAVVMLLADYFVDGFYIDGFLSAVVFSILFSVTTSILSFFGED